jgi:membrane protein implicated in regulation of membrane protease activity
MIERMTAGLSAPALWGIAAAVLAIAEIVIPGIFLLWLAIGAGITAVITLFVPLNAALQLLVFSVLSAVSVSVGRFWYVSRPAKSTDPLLNDRAARLIGRPVTVSEAIVQGEGRVRVDDSSWSAIGPDAPVGARLTVIEVDGSTLVVAYPAA